MKPKWDSEKELAKVIVDYLKGEGWTMYPELCGIDIIATKENTDSPNGIKVIGIECKKHFNLRVLSQAYEKRRFVDQMYVGVSDGWKNDEHFGCKIARTFGYGVFFVKKMHDYRNRCFTYSLKEVVEPETCNRTRFDVDKLFDPRAENYAEAGQAGGKCWSEFRKTAYTLTDYVTVNPGKSLKDVVAAIEHHYANSTSARSSLKKLIESNVIKGVRLENDLLFPSDQPNNNKS